MRLYYSSKISKNMSETPEGFLICHDVPIARIGYQEYLGYEIGAKEDNVKVYRPAEEVFKPETLSSFEGKTFTNDHPYNLITKNDNSVYDKGHAQNIRRSGDYIIADIFIKDPTAIDAVKNGKREISAGYDADIVFENGKYITKNIIGNHIALVERGRAGAAVSIKDNFEEQDHPRDNNGKFAGGGSDSSLKSDADNFRKNYRELKENPNKIGKQLTVLNKPSKCWTEAGLPDKEIIIPYGVIEKINNEKHNISDEIIEKLPELISDPLYIFESSTQKGSFVGVLDALEDENKPDKPLIAAIKPVGESFEINIITSTYSKDGGFIKREIGKGKLKYQKNKKIKDGTSFTPASIAAGGTGSIIDIITYIRNDFNPKSNIKKTKNKENLTMKNLIGKMFAAFVKDAEPEEIEKAVELLKNEKEEPVKDEGAERLEAMEKQINDMAAKIADMCKKDAKPEEETTALDELEKEITDNEEAAKAGQKEKEEEEKAAEAIEKAKEYGEKEKQAEVSDEEIKKEIADAKKAIGLISDPVARKKVADSFVKVIRGKMISSTNYRAFMDAAKTHRNQQQTYDVGAKFKEIKANHYRK